LKFTGTYNVRFVMVTIHPVVTGKQLNHALT
jgi:hypothetical protein